MALQQFFAFPPLAVLMLTIGLGHALGRARWRRLSPGPAGGTLFVALLIGQLGLQGTASEGVTPGDLGFALFIYAVGFDAAPHLQARFGQHPWRFLLVGTAVNLLAVGTLLPLARVFELSPEAAAGVLAGALTSAPTFAAASEVAADRSALSVSFALTYPLGLLSLVLAVQVLPRLLGEDLVRDSRSDEELVRAQEARSQRYLGGSPSVVRLHRVESEEVVGRPLRELHLTSRTGCVISLVQRGGRVELANADTLLELGDHVLAEGRVDELRVFEEVVGPEESGEDLLLNKLPSRRIQVRHADVVGRSLRELDLIRRHRCVVTTILRGRLRLEPDAHVILRKDDVLEIMGHRHDLRDTAESLGRFARRVNEVDVAVHAIGLLLGLLLGSLRMPLGDFELSLGTGGGLLLVGLLLGWEQRFGLLRTHVPREARHLLRDLGILLFVAETGLAAGPSLWEGVRQAPIAQVTCGIAINLVAILGSLVIARKLLGLRPIESWGSTCGGLTSSAALHAVRQASDSNEGAASYAAAFAVASILATLAGPLVIMLLR